MQYNKTIGLTISVLVLLSGCNNANQANDANQGGQLVLTRDADGYDAEGYNPLGLNKDGFDRRGYNAQGCDKDGNDFFGMTCADRKEFADNKVSYATYTNLQAQLGTETARANTCTTDLALCTTNLTARTTERNDARAQNQVLQQSVTDKNTELGQKQQTITQLRTDIAMKDEAIQQKEITIATLTAQATRHVLDIATKEEQIRTLAANKTKLEDDLGSSTKQQTNLQKQLQDKQQKVHEHEAQLAQNAHKSKQLTQEVTDLKNRLQEQERNALQHQQELASAKAEDGLQKVIDQLRPTFEALKSKQKVFLFGDNVQGLTKDTIVPLVKKLLEKRPLSLSSSKAKHGKENISPSASPTKKSIIKKVVFGESSDQKQVSDNNTQALPVQQGKSLPGSPSTPGDVGTAPDIMYFSDLEGEDDEVGDNPPPITFDLDTHENLDS